MSWTKFVAIGAVALAGAGAAHAQAAACQPLTKLMTSTHAQVKALQGAQVKADATGATFTSKTQLPGFTACQIQSDKVKDNLSGYWEHHFSCDAEAANSEAANAAIEALWACTKDSFGERAADEAFIGGKYRVIGFEAEVPVAGRAAGLVSFGTTDYARVDVEKAYDSSEEYDIHLYWLFKN